MKTKPLFFTFMPLLFVCLALAMPLQIALIYGISPFELGAIFSKLTPVNILLIGLFSWMAVGVYKMDKNLFILLPFINLIVFINNYIVGSFGADFSIYETTLASTVFLAVTLSFYTQNIYRAFNETNFRWWLTRPRKEVGVPLTIYTSNETIRTRSFDVSESGLFAVNDRNFELFQTSKNQEIDLNIHLADRVINCKGKIVRKALSKGKYPEGVGIHFSKSDHTLQSWLQTQAA